MSKYGVISGPYFPVLSPNIGKYGPETTPYLDTFYAMNWDGISYTKNIRDNFLRDHLRFLLLILTY